MHGLSIRVGGNFLEAFDIANVVLRIGVDEHQEGCFDRRRVVRRTGSQNGGDEIASVAFEAARYFAEHRQANLAIHGGAGVSAGIELVGATLQGAVTDHLAHQAHTLTQNLLLRLRDVVFIHIFDEIRVVVDRSVLLDLHRDVLHVQLVHIGRDAFLCLVCHCIHRPSVDCCGVGGRSAVGQIATELHSVGHILADLVLGSGNAQGFLGLCVAQDCAFGSADPRFRRVESVTAHYLSP